MLTMLSSIITGPKKWVKGAAFFKQGKGKVSLSEDWDCCCLVGGCHLTGYLQASLEACKMAITELGFFRRMEPNRPLQSKHPVALFNDHPDTTWEDVSAVIKRADEIIKDFDE